MFSNVTIALIFAIGAGAWVYSKIQHNNGGQSQRSLIVAGAAAFFLFLTMLIVLGISK
jgi:predicted RNase H-related nuclease YkuK (DUF458 family)